MQSNLESSGTIITGTHQLKELVALRTTMQSHNPLKEETRPGSHHPDSAHFPLVFEVENSIYCGFFIWFARSLHHAFHVRSPMYFLTCFLLKFPCFCLAALHWNSFAFRRRPSFPRGTPDRACSSQYDSPGRTFVDPCVPSLHLLLIG